MRLIRYLSVSAIVLCLLLGAMAAPASGLNICSWNLKHYGYKNHKNLPAVAQILARCDLVGIQEVMYPDKLAPLVQALEQQTGVHWQSTSSRAVGGNGYKEGYAFVWRQGKVKHDGGDVMYINPGHEFLRQPFSALFQAADGSTPEFVAATVHIKFGDGIRDRTPEIQALADYWQWLGESFDQKPRILMGDFNLRIKGRKAWRPLSKLAIPHVIDKRTSLSKKPGQYASAYDHFWVSKSLNVTHSGVIRAPEMLDISHKTAYAYLSDHVPIFLTLGYSRMDLSPVKTPKISDRQGSTKVKTGCIDVNQASRKRLKSLSHIGPARAKAIVKGRPWEHFEDLTQIRGLTKNRLRDIVQNDSVCPLPASN